VGAVGIEAACQRARGRNESQPLVIAAIPSVALCWLIPHLDGFRKLHPDVETRVIYAMHGRDINFNEAHVAFAFAARPPDISGVEAIRFLPGASVPVCSPTLVADLDGLPWVRPIYCDWACCTMETRWVGNPG
jgi:LysR family transcriptional regulator, glycine cleavage system transcriptional activator